MVWRGLTPMHKRDTIALLDDSLVYTILGRPTSIFQALSIAILIQKTLKMKKKIYPILLLMLGHFALAAQGGAYTTYKMVIKGTGQCVTNEKNVLAMADVKTGQNAWSQYFIAAHIDDRHVLLASASDSRLFLQRLNGKVVLGGYSDGDPIGPFSWQLHYAGGNYHYLTSGTGQTTLALQAEGGAIKMAEPPFISGCSNSIADMFRMRLEPVTNTF